MPLLAQAEVLTPAEALGRAAESLPATVSASRRAAARLNSEPLLTIGAAEPEVYVFGSVAGGLVVASAESETAPLLGYSEFYVEGSELPPALEWMVEQYGREINALRAGDVIERKVRRDAKTDYAAIAPICKTTWNQTKPYCYDCPVIGDYYCVTGCVATAMAQVLKTYEYPAKCSGGTFSYRWSNGNKDLSKNFNNVTLDWANMLDSYPSSPSTTLATSKAVANLMSALGYASQMNYSTSSSGTNGAYCAEGLVRNFGYDYNLQYHERSWYDLADWNKKVYDEIAAGHPVYYDGLNLKEKVGHAFVIDGYQANGYFHVNWGWGGQLNGYFLLTALDPDGEQGVGGSSGGYSDGCAAIFNMNPGQTMTAATAPLTLYCSEPLKAPSTSIKLGGTFADAMVIYNYCPFVMPEAWIVLRFADEAGNEYYSSAVSGLDNMPVLSGLGGDVGLTIPSNLHEGVYTVSRVAYNPNTDEFYELFYDFGVASKLTAEVKGTNITFSKYVEPIEGTMFFDNVTFPSEIYFDEPFQITSEFYNVTDNDYTGRLYLDFYKKGTSQLILSYSTVELTLPAMTYMSFNPTASIETGAIEPGEYTICLSCDDESVMSETKDVVIKYRASVVQGSNFECTSTDMSGIGFKVDLTALNSNYSGMVAFAIAKTKNSPVLWSDKFNINIPAGQTVTKTYTDIDLSSKLTAGTNYIVYGLYVDESGKSVNLDGESKVSFTATAEQVGIEPISTESEKSEYFDLSGRRVKNASTGIYIRRKGTNTQTIQIR